MNHRFQPRILGLILARGGSKRLPGKNIKPLCGKPLIAWTIEASLACARIDQTLVSTDSSAIAQVAVRHGAQVPFLRAATLAADDSTSADAAIDALDRFREMRGEEFDAVVLLEPTSPLRAADDLSGVANLLADHWMVADAVVAVGRVHREFPEIMKTRGADGFLKPYLSNSVHSESELGAPWFPYGGAYAIKVPTLRKERTFYPERLLGYPVQRWQNYEVDDEFDFICVEALMKRRQSNLLPNS